MGERSVKGTIFQNLVGELNELLAEGRLSKDQLTAHLKPDELDWLDRDISIAGWYSLDLYCRMLKLYALAAPGAPGEFLVESGRRSARRVVDLGIYSQLDTRSEETWENRIGRMLVTLSGSFFSFGRWEWQGLTGSGDGFEIYVHDSACMTDEIARRTGGFIEFLAERSAGGAVSLVWDRIEDGSVLRYRAQRIGR